MSFRWARPLALALCGAIGFVSLPASAGPAIRAPDAPVRDLLYTIQARRLLLDDPDLGPLNLGVQVRDRVAILWGPVPTAELALKAEVRLRNLVELLEVRNELSVTGEELPPDGPGFLPEPGPPALPPSRLDPARVPPPAVVKPIAAPPAATAKPQQPVVNPALEVELPTLRLPQPPAEAPTDLAGAIRAVVKSKEAFRAIQVTLKGQKVYLADTAQNADVLHELARAISRLPGVEGVVLQEAQKR